MNKQQFYRKVSDACGFTQADVERVCNAVRDTVMKEVEAGEKVDLPGLGQFKPVERAPRTSFSAILGRDVHTPAKTAVKFRPAKAFSDFVNKG